MSVPHGNSQDPDSSAAMAGSEPSDYRRRKGWLIKRVQPGKPRPRKNSCGGHKPQQRLVMELSQRSRALQRSGGGEAALDDAPFSVSFL